MGFGAVDDRADLTVPDGIRLGPVETLGEHLTRPLVHYDSPEGGLGIAARDLYRPAHVPLVVHSYLPSRCRRASSSSGYRNSYPDSLSLVESARILARSISSAKSPRTIRARGAGSGKTVGRFKMRFRVSVYSRAVTGLGTALTGPCRESVVRAWRITPATSSVMVQLQYCLPDPIQPPPVSLKTGNVASVEPLAPNVISNLGCSIPTLRPKRSRENPWGNTMPNRGCTTRMPAFRAGSAACSHSWHTRARKLLPGPLSSRKSSFPLLP